MLSYKRDHYCGLLSEKDVGSVVHLSGWVQRTRDLGGRRSEQTGHQAEGEGRPPQRGGQQGDHEQTSPVAEPAQSREYQKRADELRDDAEDLSDNVIIHVYASRPLSQYVLNVAESKLGGDDNNAVTHMDAGVSVGDNDPAAAADACDKDIGLHFQFGEGDSHHG